jgi:hypothetical protein
VRCPWLAHGHAHHCPGPVADWQSLRGGSGSARRAHSRCDDHTDWIRSTVGQVSNAQGQARFLGLPVCTCVLKAELEGFATGEYPFMSVIIGRATTATVTLKPAVEDAGDTASTASPDPSETARGQLPNPLLTRRSTGDAEAAAFARAHQAESLMSPICSPCPVYAPGGARVGRRGRPMHDLHGRGHLDGRPARRWGRASSAAASVQPAGV